MYVHGNQESDCLRFFSTPGGLGVGHRIRQMFFFFFKISLVFMFFNHQTHEISLVDDDDDA